MKTILSIAFVVLACSVFGQGTQQNRIITTSAAFRALATNETYQAMAQILGLQNPSTVIQSSTNIPGGASNSPYGLTNTAWDVVIPPGTYLSQTFLNIQAGTNVTGIVVSLGNGIDTTIISASAAPPTNGLSVFQSGTLTVTGTNAYILNVYQQNTNAAAPPILITNSFWTLTPYN